MPVVFENTQINKFLATSFLYNQASIKVLQRLGFTCDGVIEMEIEHAELGKLDLLSYHLEVAQRNKYMLFKSDVRIIDIGK